MFVLLCKCFSLFAAFFPQLLPLEESEKNIRTLIHLPVSQATLLSFFPLSIQPVQGGLKHMAGNDSERDAVPSQHISEAPFYLDVDVE